MAIPFLVCIYKANGWEVVYSFLKNMPVAMTLKWQSLDLMTVSYFKQPASLGTYFSR